MKKVLLLAAVAAMIMGSAAAAQDSIIGFDIRDGVTDGQKIPPTNVGTDVNWPWTEGDHAAWGIAGYEHSAEAAHNAGGFGDGQVLRIACHHNDSFEDGNYPNAWPNFDGDGDMKTGQMWLWATVNDAGGCTDDVISSIGIDFETYDAGAGGWNRIAGMTFAWESMVYDETNEGKADGGPAAGDPPTLAGAKMVKVPVVSPGPTYDASGGLVPGTVPPTDYRIGKLTFTGDLRTCPTDDTVGDFEDNSTFELYLRTNQLLITRTCDGNSHVPENVQFGYWPADATIPGNQDDEISTDPDAMIVVNLKGDFDGNGVVDDNDIVGYLAAKAASNPPGFPPPPPEVTQRQLYMGDFETFSPPGDSNKVDDNDTAGFVHAKLTGGISTFPPPANCP